MISKIEQDGGRVVLVESEMEVRLLSKWNESMVRMAMKKELRPR